MSPWSLRYLGLALPFLAACAAPAPPASVSPAPKERSEPPPAFARWIDLDGDGRLDSVRVVVPPSAPAVPLPSPRVDIPCDAEASRPTCRARLSVGERFVDLDVPSGHFGGLGVQFVDIDQNDARKEILITQRAGDGEDPPYVFTIVSFDGKTLKKQELWSSRGYSSGTIDVRGDGNVEVRYDECPDASTVLYRLRGRELVEVKRTVVRTQPPESCAG